MEQTPNDLITLSEAQDVVKRSRTWIMGRVRAGRLRLWEQGGVYKVSRAALITASDEYNQLRPIDLTKEPNDE